MSLKRRGFLKTLAAGSVLSPSALQALERIYDEEPCSTAAPGDIEELYRQAIVIDALCVVGGEVREIGDADWDAIERSGYTAIQTTLGSSDFETAVNQLAGWARRFREYPDRLVKVLKVADIERAKDDGMMGVMLGFQNATMLEDRIENLDTLYDLGTRCIQLTYNSRNLLGDGCTERTSCGLSHFGVAVVERMNELGIVVDLSHCGMGTTADGIEVSSVPPCFTHTMSQTVYSSSIRHPRAKTDDEMTALAEKGGVMGIATLGYFVGPDEDTSFADYLDHIEHAVNVMGIDHVGLCTDHQLQGVQPWATRENWYEPRLRSFDPSYNVRWPPWIPQVDTPERFLNVAKGLDERGWAWEDIEKILGANWMWYFREVLGG